MILKMCFSSCTRMPVRPTYEGHFDLTTVTDTQEITWGYTLCSKHLAVACNVTYLCARTCFICIMLYLLKQHHGNQLSGASAGSSVGYCIQTETRHDCSLIQAKNYIQTWRDSVLMILHSAFTLLVSIHCIDPQCTVSKAHAEVRRAHTYKQNQLPDVKKCIQLFS